MSDLMSSADFSPTAFFISLTRAGSTVIARPPLPVAAPCIRAGLRKLTDRGDARSFTDEDAAATAVTDIDISEKAVADER